MSTNKSKILLVEDEQAISEAVAAYLTNDGFGVVPVFDGQEALKQFEEQQFDLVVLDLMLPKVSGEIVCRTIREKSQVPIIMLTAKGEVEDRIYGLELGADDYLVKPFSPRELVARVRALLRRVKAGEITPDKPDFYDFGSLKIDISGYKVTVDDVDAKLTPSEFKILSAMAANAGKVYSRVELAHEVLDYDFEGYERTIDSHIKNLRAKIGDDSKNPKWIFTVHGVGYRFENPVK